ncbi:keto-deoxy-phosphogluconate aldolase [Alteromonas abrolhosensis]|uniref:keto-deoxy-phosphogluconate aldolase n=1 Tax=Alteromonas abrolhosensis TaxID=1892904 RepID=UPI00096B94A9|nr:keto-deoxy-phosphogluconate aldolase [Alteromonas abrolhosensis]
MKSTFSMLKGAPLLPIIQPKSVDEGLHLAEAIANSGLCNIEVVKRSDAAFEALSAIRKQFPELVVGMGTLLNRNHVFEALDAGAQFLITPTSSETLLDTLIASNAPFLPGVATPADILLAHQKGIREMKFFPASLSGGINGDNANEYLSLGNVRAVGGTWMMPKAAIEAKNWQAITLACQQSLTLFDEAAA